ncbi:MAG TPA: ABC transporter permease [Tepidisphaeraceae bacterium]|nr:ABC transporter permease [Tepidisphaeraceae bacterium]
MFRFIAFRILQFPLILAIIYVGTFLLCWVAPGDPFQRTERPLPPQVAESLRRQYHAETWYGFLVYYPIKMIQGDFGPSFNFPGRSVGQIIKDTLPVSATVGLIAMLIAVIVGTFIGTLAAVYRSRAPDWISLTVALVGVSLPSFVVAALLRALFAFEWDWFPVGSWTWSPKEMVLPAVALSLLPMAYVARLTRVSMIDTLSSDYIRTARAKGVGRLKVIFKHALRNAVLPVLSYIGPATAITMTGSFVVETVFQLPGMGDFFVRSVEARDQTMILGVVMIYSSMLLALNLLTDIGYTFVDPRISVS